MDTTVSTGVLRRMNKYTDAEIAEHIGLIEINIAKISALLAYYGPKEDGEDNYFQIRQERLLREQQDILDALNEVKYRRMPCEYQI